jgi:hypothetical protein
MDSDQQRRLLLLKEKNGRLGLRASRGRSLKRLPTAGA